MEGGREDACYFRGSGANRGSEPYSAWFADRDGPVLYFGASPFWTLWWERGGDPTADLDAPGDRVIGRFDMDRLRFLPPLRPTGGAGRGSVWDVLVHSGGRVFYTTFLEEMGSIRTDGRDPRVYPHLGPGLNELAEGPDGRIYVTRYTTRPLGPPGGAGGSLLAVEPDGRLVREFPISDPGAWIVAPKSVAVDPLSGEIWVNADLFGAGEPVGYAYFRLSPDGTLLEGVHAPPEIHSIAFDRDGLGWIAEDRGGELHLRAVRSGRTIATTSLGRRAPLDFVQDVKPAGEGRAVVALWSGRAFVATLGPAGLTLRAVRFVQPLDCVPPIGRSLLYTAVEHRGQLFGTLYCGLTVVRAPIEAAIPPRPPAVSASGR